MIELKNIDKSYSSKTGVVFALKNINLKINAGEIFGVIGKSGAGKSTLIRCVNLLERPTRGEVLVNAKDLTKLPQKELLLARREIGMIFQHFNLLTSRTVYQNVALPLELIGKSKIEIEQIIRPLLELTSLTDKENNYPSQLSGGQKQRVAIARSLACKPKVLLCDEATSALDLQTTKAILQLLKDINEKLGLTILLITHEMDVIKEISDRVALIEHGEIVEQAETTDFFVRPQNIVAKDLVKSSLKQELPTSLQNIVGNTKSSKSNPVIRLLFHGKTAEEPLIAQLMSTFGMKLNILQANIEFLKRSTIGVMVAEVIETNNNLESVITYLETLDVKVEIIGYVDRNAIRII